MAYISKVNVPGDQTTYDIKSKKTAGIPFGQVDSSSTSTVFTATVDGITELYDGVCCYLKNGVVTSASGFTININGLGAKPVYSSMAAATALTTVFNINYTALLIYNSSRVSGGCWDFYYGYYTSSNTIGYQLRTNSSTRPVTSACYRYRICFSNADNTKWVPANASTSTNATSSRTVTTTPIDPFGRIIYYGYTTAVSSGGNLSATYQWDQYALTLGYSFNRTGAALVLTYPAPVYIKCAPQSDGTAIIDADNPYVQALPSTADGKIYIYLGQAYSATQVEMTYAHPVYEYKDGHVRLWTNAAVGANVDVTPNRAMGNSIATINGTDILAYDVYDADLGTIGTFPSNLVPLDGTSAQYTNSSWSTISSELVAAIIGHQDVFVHGTIYADDDSSLLPLTFKLKHLSNVSVDLDFMPVFSGIAVDGTGTNPTSVILGILGDTVSIACVRLQGKLEIEDSVVENSANPVTSGAVYNALLAKINANDILINRIHGESIATINGNNVYAYSRYVGEYGPINASSAITPDGTVNHISGGSSWSDMYLSYAGGFTNELELYAYGTVYIAVSQSVTDIVPFRLRFCTRMLVEEVGWAYVFEGVITNEDASRQYHMALIHIFNTISVAITELAKYSDIPNVSNFITSSDVPTYETDPTVPSWAKASTKPSYTASEVGALPNTGEAEFTGASSVLILKGGAAENSPALRFQRGTLTDNYNDWQMQDRGGFLYFEQRGNGSSAWSEIAHFDTTGNLYCTGLKAYLDWSYVSNKPTIPTVDATPTSGSTNAVSSGGVYDMIGDVETLLASI